MKFKLVSLIVLFAFVYSVHAEQYKIQGLTDYQNDRLALLNTTMSDLTNSMGELEKQSWLFQFVEWLKEHEFEYKIKENDPLGELELVEAYIDKTCGIMPWMIGSGDNTILEEIQFRKYNAICHNYQLQRKELDEKQTAETLVYESKLQQERAEIRAKSNKIITQIRKDFAAWKTKGQYEKTAIYEQRLMDYSHCAFDSICQKSLESNWMNNLQFRFGEYNPDTEILDFELSYADANGNKICGVSYNFSIRPDLVEDFKRYALRSAWIESAGIYQGYYFPIKFCCKKYVSKWEYIIVCANVITKGVEPLMIVFDDLGIENQYLKGTIIPVSFDRYNKLYFELQDSIIACNNKLNKLYEQYKNYRYKIGHQESHLVTKYSNNEIPNINTSMLTYYTGSVECFKDRTMINKINPSDESFEIYMGDIRQYYNECMDFYVNLEELNLLFPDITGEIESVYEKIRQRASAPFHNEKFKFKDCQEPVFIQLSKAKTERLKKLFSSVCVSILKNKDASNEYSKNSQYFSSKEDFVIAYALSGNYKAELKSRKNK